MNRKERRKLEKKGNFKTSGDAFDEPTDEERLKEVLTSTQVHTSQKNILL